MIHHNQRTLRRIDTLAKHMHETNPEKSIESLKETLRGYSNEIIDSLHFTTFYTGKPSTLPFALAYRDNSGQFMQDYAKLEETYAAIYGKK